MKIKLQDADKPNKNNRVYPKGVLEKESKKWTETFVKEKRALISKSQPIDGVMNLKDIVGQITYIGVEDNCLVAEAESLSVISKADEIMKLLEEGKLHARISGMGTLTKQDDGTYLVGEDFELTGIFLTDDPA